MKTVNMRNSEIRNGKSKQGDYHACMALQQAAADRVGKRVKWYRKYIGLSGSEFARSIDVLPSQLSDWEKGKARLSIQGALKIYDVYDITPDFFFLEKTNQLPQELSQAWHSQSPQQSA